MTNAERMAVLMGVFNTVFQSKQLNTDITKEIVPTNTGRWPGRLFNKGTLRGFDFTINLGDRTINLRCLEQNPNKIDDFGNLKKYAILARQGHLIMWVIDTKNDQFLGRIHNGVWHASFVPATQPASYQPVSGTPNVYDSPEQEAREDAAYAHVNKEWQNSNADVPLEVDQLPEIPNGMGIPDYVLDHVADMDEPPAWDDH